MTKYCYQQNKTVVHGCRMSNYINISIRFKNGLRNDTMALIDYVITIRYHMTGTWDFMQSTESTKTQQLYSHNTRNSIINTVKYYSILYYINTNEE